MFMRDMFKIVHAIKQGDDEAAMDLAGDLLSLYNRLIYALINGIFSKDESKKPILGGAHSVKNNCSINQINGKTLC